MFLDRLWSVKNTTYLENKVTLSRQGAPLLYAHDACTFASRLRGVHGIPPLRATDALIIRPCKAIHTFGLIRAIDVAFLDEKGVVLKLRTVQPGKFMFCWNAVVAVEMNHGTAMRIGMEVGQCFVSSKGSC